LSDANVSLKRPLLIDFLTAKVSELKFFLTATIPLYFLSLVLLRYQKSDIGGARFDTELFHLPVIEYIAHNWRLPDPVDYGVFSLPLWHFIAALLLQFPSGEVVLHTFQVLVGMTTLYLIFKMLSRSTSNLVAGLGSATLALNSYFVSSSFFPTTDGLAIFTFVLFLFATQKIYTEVPSRWIYVLLTCAIVFSALNRQMFVYLFIVYFIVFFRKKKLLRILLELLPAGFLVTFGFLYFYLDYCGLLSGSSCATVGTFQQLPVVLNLSGAGILFAFFTLPVFLDREIFAWRNIAFLISLFAFVIVFFFSFGTSSILSSRVGSGGAIFLLRNRVFNDSPWFDILSVSIFILGIILAYTKFVASKWLVQSAIVIWLFTLLGPAAFQRYFEPYLLILGILLVYSNWKTIFNSNLKLFFLWIAVLIGFQGLEFSLSAMLVN
jgi:hypothetical protein